MCLLTAPRLTKQGNRHMWIREKGVRNRYVKAVCTDLCLYVYVRAPGPSPYGGSNLQSPSDFTK